jgi:hypothetical protein
MTTPLIKGKQVAFSTENALPASALWLSAAVPLLIGTAFMMTARKQLVYAFSTLEVLQGKTLAPELGGLFTHAFFMVGVLAWSFGAVQLCLALDVEPALAVTSGFTSCFGTMLFRVITGTGITGVPGVAGQPGELIMGMVTCALTANLLASILSGRVPTAFYVCYTFAVVGPQWFGLMARSGGWMTHPKHDGATPKGRNAHAVKVGTPLSINAHFVQEGRGIFSAQTSRAIGVAVMLCLGGGLALWMGWGKFFSDEPSLLDKIREEAKALKDREQGTRATA